MAFTNSETREINCKIVFVGAGGSGKTENLKAVFHQTSTEIKAGLLEFDARHQPSKYFDFLPISMGDLQGFHVKFHLFTLPVHSAFQSVQPLILRGMDGYVLVVDSRLEWLPDNVQAWQRFRRDMVENGHNPSETPGVVQYNKRDCANALPIPILRQALNELNLPEHEAVATKSLGIMETLQAIAKQILNKNGIQSLP